MCTTCRLKRAS